VEDYSFKRLTSLSDNELEDRFAEIKRITQF
jgi:hypothetical protein